jgi:hypothetical protein
LHDRTDELIRSADALHARISDAQRSLFAVIAEIDRTEAWRDSGARDTAHWLWMRYGISSWKAHRWIAAAKALPTLPRIGEAFARGDLGIDKVVELTRIAEPTTEVGLISWAAGVSSGAIRRRADMAIRRSSDEVEEIFDSRHLSWWYFDEGTRFGLEAELPADQGAAVAKALARIADELPSMPDSEPSSAEVRRADALVALCAARITRDDDPDRATVIVHVPVATLTGGDENAGSDDGAVIGPDAARRLACNARLQVMFEDAEGQPVRLGRMTREPTAAMMRQLRYRDRECRFPGCGSRRFTHAHHVVWWGRGGRTDLDNLVLLCSFHHRLVHEHGWALERRSDGQVRWFDPGGARYRAGPAPPGPPRRGPTPTHATRSQEEPMLLAVG